MLVANSDLTNYISSLRAQKIPEESIKAELLKHGWAEPEVLAALNPTNQTNITLPPPPVPRVGMWITFQYIILFICLYVSATALAGIMHIGVDQLLPDPLKSSYSGFDYLQDVLLKGYLAGIIVTFPIFAILFLLVKRAISQKPFLKNVKARKTLLYLTLVLTFLIMICHLISTLFGFLNGGTTLNSLAHLGITFLVAGSIFIYLLLEVKEDRKSNA